MLKNELLKRAIHSARLNPLDTKVYAMAERALDAGIRKFSADSTITDFQRIKEDVTLINPSMTIGRPVPKKGKYFTCVSELPDITGYDPSTNNFGIVMNRDYYFVGATCYEIQEVTGTTTTYAWVAIDKEDWGDFCDKVPDVVIMDLESIIGMTDEKGELIRKSLIDYNRDPNKDRKYTIVNEGNGVLRIYANAGYKVSIVYIPELNVSEWEHLELSYEMIDVLINFIGQEIARTAEMKEDLAKKLQSSISVASNSSIEWSNFIWG